MFASARKAAGIVFNPAFSAVVLKALALTILLFALLFAGFEYGIHRLLVLHPNWPSGLLTAFGSVFFVMLAFVLGAPVAALFAALFLDDIAEALERKCYCLDPPAQGPRFWRSLATGLRLFGLTLFFGLMMLPLNLLIPGVGTTLSLLVSGWLLGREYFEMVAVRHVPLKSADSLRRRHSLSILAGGLLIAVLAAIPFIGFVAP